MAADIAYASGYLITLDIKHRDLLKHIRHWENIQMAVQQNECCLTGFTDEQIKSLEVKSIPFIHIYEIKNGLLFRQNGRVPQSEFPADLLWKPLTAAIPVSLPAMNYNYFGLKEKITLRLAPSETERTPVAMLLPAGVLKAYIGTSPAVRLRPLQWLLLHDAVPQALIWGEPLLPLPGSTFWRQDSMLIPTGWEPAFPALNDHLLKMLRTEMGQIIFWKGADEIVLLERRSFKPLSISSVRLTLET